jgi:PhnB protein
MANDLFEGSAITPYLITKGAEEAIAFYVAAFGAVENYRLIDPQSGKIGHADLAIGGASFMLADEHPDFGALSPATLGARRSSCTSMLPTQTPPSPAPSAPAPRCCARCRTRCTASARA